MHTLTTRAGFVAGMKLPARSFQLREQASVPIRRTGDLAKEPHLTATPGFQKRQRHTTFVNVQIDKCAMFYLVDLLFMRLGIRPSGTLLD